MSRRSWDRTSDLLGVNFSLGRRQMWPAQSSMRFICEGAGSMWPDKAWCQALLAPPECR
jgi:hypothetical protein